jgi:hypothetical protein
MVAGGKNVLWSDDLDGLQVIDFIGESWVRGLDLNQRPSGYEQSTAASRGLPLSTHRTPLSLIIQ